ncbi:hypothetical protein [Natronosalvus vescus]|uniref:hypothetical protein n=1 Tax=Natronosalvus vescus TaxID=2953881 RepID=UPI002091145C|nr:hypothetical protein [Natronosalvus vescus]
MLGTEKRPYPFQGVVNSSGEGFIGYNQGDLERECLISNREDLPEVSGLSIEDLGRLPIELVRLMKIQRTPDHDAVWKEAAFVIKEVTQEDDPVYEELVENVELLVRAILADPWGSIGGEFGWNERSNQEFVLNNASLLARYMAFPTLEGIVKSLCRKDIEKNGTVRPGRVILGYGSIDHYSGNEQCNNIGHLLWHLEQDAADEPLSSRMQQFREAYAEFFSNVPSNRVYGHLAKNRNTVLHGEKRAQAEFGMLLNLISLIIFNIDSVPEERRTTPE